MGYIKGEDGVEGVTKGTYLRYDVYTWGADLQPQAACKLGYCTLSAFISQASSLFSLLHNISSHRFARCHFDQT